MAFSFWYKLSRQLRTAAGSQSGGAGDASRTASMASMGSAANMADGSGGGGGGAADGDALPGPPPLDPAAAEAERARQRAFFAPAFERLLSTARQRMRCGCLTSCNPPLPCFVPAFAHAPLDAATPPSLTTIKHSTQTRPNPTIETPKNAARPTACPI